LGQAHRIRHPVPAIQIIDLALPHYGFKGRMREISSATYG
jgi:hypothetical protein